MAETENQETRARILQVFRYLKALNEHRNPVARQIDSQQFRLWMRELPEHTSIHKTLRKVPQQVQSTDADHEERPMLTVTRPTFTPCPPPPDEIREWIIGDWENPRIGSVKWKTSRNIEITNDHTEIESFDSEREREESLEKWISQRNLWCENELPALQAKHVFDQLYELYLRLGKDSEKAELVLGNGILSCLAQEGATYFPVLLKRVELAFDPSVPEFTVLDTDSALELNITLLQSLSIINQQAFRHFADDFRAGAANGSIGSGVTHPLDEEVNGLLKVMAGQLSGNGQFVEYNRPDRDCTDFTVGNWPVLFVRPRSQGFGRAIVDVLDGLATRPTFCDALTRIVGTHSNREHLHEDFVPDETREPESSVLFGKKANKEQLKIAQRLERFGSVLVQGPPGTGKSHTIANLIGHLLAEGKSILVTSHTTKALRVLHGQIDESLRPLCVSILDNDAASQRELEESVRAISDRLSNSSAHAMEREAAQFATERNALVLQLGELRHRLQATLENEYREIVFAGESISPSDAARFVRSGERQHDWIPGPISVGPLPLSKEQVDELYRSNGLITANDERLVDIPLPSLDELSNPDIVSSIFAELNNSSSAALHAAHRHLWPNVRFSEQNVRELERLAARLQSAVVRFKTFEEWEIAAFGAGWEGSMAVQAWQLLLSQIARTSELEVEGRLLSLRLSPGTSDVVPIEKQLKIAEEIVAYLTSKNTLGWLSVIRRRDWKSLIPSWQITSGKPEKHEHFVAIAQALRLTISRRDLKLLWGSLMGCAGAGMPSAAEPKIEEYCKQFEMRISNALRLWQAEWEPAISELRRLGFDWESCLSLQAPVAGSAGGILRIVGCIESCVIAHLFSAASWIRMKLTERRLSNIVESISGFVRPEVELLRDALGKRDGESYKDAFVKLNEAIERQKIAKARCVFLTALKTQNSEGDRVAPEWANQIERRLGQHAASEVPGDVDAAWRWRQYHDELMRRSQANIEDIQRKIEQTSDQLQEVTVSLIERRAWARQLRNSHTFQQDLIGWLQTVRHIRGGFGMRTAQLQNEARRKMRKCRGAVPVWIMPISRLVDNFDFSDTQFDVVIIDEASQCDVMGLLAIALAKRIVVVGDNEQVSPTAIGQNIREVESLIDTWLKGIPNADLYDGLMSIYDLAQQSFGGLIALREHFRCTTEIIEFSNHLSYDGRVLPLRDDPQFRDQVIEYHVEAGARDGRVNSKEATAIASLVVAALEFPEYAECTIGVISMVSDVQALEIERMLRIHLSTETFEERRITCGNSAQFQGDERDVMFLSVVDVPRGGPLPIRQETKFRQRFNVAASRAKNQMWVVHSLNPSTDLKAGDLRKRLIEHARDPQALRSRRDAALRKAQSPFEEAVLKLLMSKGYDVVPQWEVGCFSIDIVIRDHEKKLAVECDGDRFHGADKVASDMERQAILERVGWRFHRIRGSDFFRDPDSAMNRLYSKLESLGIRPFGVDTFPAVAKARDSLTSHVIRRAEEIRQEWAKGEVHAPVEEAPVYANAEGASAVTDDHPITSRLDDVEQDEVADVEPVEAMVGQSTRETIGNQELICNLLKEHPEGLKLPEISRRLGISRQEVNSLLHYELVGRVRLNWDFQWFVNDEAPK